MKSESLILLHFEGTVLVLFGNILSEENVSIQKEYAGAYKCIRLHSILKTLNVL